ncbi:MAG: HNH endonuclease [Cyanobium usitatum Tobar12.5m-G36]|nr:HNH endonuclease [Cyanobium usitatum Tobar12.5m-G36]
MLRVAKNYTKQVQKMKNSITISKLFEELGCPLKIGYHWSATSPDKKRAVFTVWDDEVLGNEYNLIPEGSLQWMHRPGGVQLKKDIEVALSSGIETLGILCHKVDPLASPPKRKYFDEKSLLVLNLIKQNEGVLAVISGEVSVDTAINGPVAEYSSERQSALDDLDGVPESALVPERLRVEGFAYKRNRMVRDHVVNRANGRCEYCGEKGFLMANGKRYIETHHIMGLGDNGPDTLANVIGLCPEHHREAHFGEKPCISTRHLRILPMGYR